ncbi:MAG TPA: efflux RND transporter periplasmic adaptor subunit, partial [Spirochaetota bacterium]
NDFVKKGTVLAEIDAPDLNFNAQQTRETLTQMTITLDAAKEALIAKESLFKENLVAEKEYTAAKRDYDRALSAYRQTKNNMDKINQDLINRIVRSTVAGQVIQVFGVPFAAVGKGTDLFQITANIKKMTLVLNVDESDIGIVSVGKPVEFTVSAYQDKKFTGKITTISTTPIMQGNIVTYSTLGECDNSLLLLKPGMSVTASIFVNKVGSVLRIPNEAFSISPEFTESTPGKKFVWKRKKTLGAGDAEDMVRVEVTTGLSGNGYTQFVSGKLKEGDEVLVKIKRQQKGKSIPGL